MSDVKIYGNPTSDFTIIRLLGEHEYNIEDEIKLLSKRSVLMGSVFDVKDIICYGVGCIILGLYEYYLYKRNKK